MSASRGVWAMGTIEEIGEPVQSDDGVIVSVSVRCEDSALVAFVARRELAREVIESYRVGDAVRVEGKPASKRKERRDGTGKAIYSTNYPDRIVKLDL